MVLAESYSDCSLLSEPSESTGSGWPSLFWNGLAGRPQAPEDAAGERKNLRF